MNVSATIRTVLCAGVSPAQFYELSYTYTDDGDRLPSENSTLKQLLGGGFGKFPYPPELGRAHLALWRRADRCVVAAAHEHGGLQSLREEEIGAVIADIERNRPRFLPNPAGLLLHYLTTNEDIDTPATEPTARDALEGIERSVGLERLRRIRQVVLRHGRSYVTQPLPPGFAGGELGTCHADAIQLAVRSGLTYVEGFALIGPGRFALLHGWCADDRGRVIDRTWKDRGTAYFGVPIQSDYLRRKQREFEAQPPGTVTCSLFNDPTDRWAVLDGRTAVADWKAG